MQLLHKMVGCVEGRTRWKMIHKDIMSPHPKDASFFSPPPPYYNVSGYPVLSYFFLTVYSILTMLFARPKIVVTQRGYVLNCVSISNMLQCISIFSKCFPTEYSYLWATD